MKKQFFFDNPKKITEYVKAHCAEEMEHIISNADDMANNTILFTLRWDMEQDRTPVKFDNQIDWLHQPGADPEWTYALNRMRAWVCMGQAYAITGDEKYSEAFVRQMRHWVETVKREDPKAANAWRTIETGIRLENWLKAYQYMKASPCVTDEVESIFYASVTEHAEFIMSVWNSYNLMSNWGVLANHGLFLAGCMLPESDRAKEYIAESIDRLEKSSEIQVYADGVHWEQSPMYHNEVLRCFLDVNILAKRCGIKLPPLIAEKTKAMLYASMLAGKPNGHEIMHGDSDDIDQRDLLSIGAYFFRDSTLKSAAYPRLDFDSVWTLGYEAAVEYENLPTNKPTETAHGLADSGNFYSRSSWDADAVFVHFHCGTLGAGHGHADKLHVDLFANGEDILLDPGRFTYVPGEDRYWYKMPYAHNTTAVDGTDLYKCLDSWECKNLSRAVGQKFVQRGSYVYMEGAHLGYMEQGVYVNRRVIHIKPDILIMCDTFHAPADKERTYRQYFQWNNAGKVQGSKGQWCYESEKNTAQLILCSNKELSAGLLPGRISRHYNLQEDSQRLETWLNAKGFAGVFSVIAVDSQGNKQNLSVSPNIVHSNFKGIVFSSDDIESITVTKGERSYVIALAHKEYASPTDTFTADGCVGFGHAVVFDKSTGEGVVLLH